MSTWDEVRQIALSLPEVTEHRTNEWRIKDKGFAWERPLRPGDVAALGDRAPDGEILGVHVADLGVKEALLADNPEVYFTTPHFNGYRAILVRLDEIAVDELEELVTDAWLARAPKRVAKAFLDASPTSPDHHRPGT